MAEIRRYFKKFPHFFVCRVLVSVKTAESWQHCTPYPDCLTLTVAGPHPQCVSSY